YPNFTTVDEDGLALRGHFGRERAVHRIVLEKVGEGLGIGQVVHADDFEILGAERGPEKHAPDSTEAIDADSNAHSRAPCGKHGGCGAVTTAPKYTATYNTRATVRTPIRLAPAALSTRAHSPTVEPVVITSSTSTTCRPATLGDAAKAAATLAA